MENEIKTNSTSKKTEDVKRPKRIPLSKKSILDYKEIPGFYLRWVTDDKPGKIEAMLDAGYSYVEEKNAEGKTAEKVKRYAGVTKENKSYYLYLMKLPMEYREEDLAEKRRQSQEAIESTRTNYREFEQKEGLDISKLSQEQLRVLKTQLNNI